MSFSINAAQARSKSQRDLYIFDEIQAIMREIIVASESDKYEVVISDNTAMTESSPKIKIKFTMQNPVVAPNSTIIFNDQTIVLGTSGTNLNAVIADINDADITGLIASKDSGYLVLEIEAPQLPQWQYSFGQGTANSQLGITSGQYPIENPDSVKFFETWQGVRTDRARQNQMDQVLKYFRNLGYKIERVTNTKTSKTFSWYLYW
jgi:hypothetical protein